MGAITEHLATSFFEVDTGKRTLTFALVHVLLLSHVRILFQHRSQVLLRQREDDSIQLF
jgi:hypothetical protein